MTARQNKIYYVELVEILDTLVNKIEEAEFKIEEATTDYIKEMYSDEIYALRCLINTIEEKC